MQGQEDFDDYTDLPWFQNLPLTKEESREAVEGTLRQLRQEDLGTMVYDAGSGKRMTLRQFENKYGTEEFSREIVDASRKKALYSKETAGKIKGMHAKLMQPAAAPVTKPKPDSKPTDQIKPKKTIQEQFIPMKYGFVDKVKDADCHHNPTALLMILLKHRSWPGKMDKHRTYAYWYGEKGLIVASRSIGSLAEELGTCERTVRKYLRQLEDNGDIETVKGEKHGSSRENVYVLGKVDKSGNESMYHTLQK